jgi:hypothetical protein
MSGFGRSRLAVYLGEALILATMRWASRRRKLICLVLLVVAAALTVVGGRIPALAGGGFLLAALSLAVVDIYVKHTKQRWGR